MLNFRLTFTAISMFMLYFVNFIENLLLNANSLPQYQLYVVHFFGHECIISRSCYSLLFFTFSFSHHVDFIVVYDLIEVLCVLFVLHALVYLLYCQLGHVRD